MDKIIQFIKKELVLFIAAILTIFTMVLVPPNKGYVEYINYQVLVILFSLMAIVAGFQEIGAFKALSIKLVAKVDSQRKIGAILVLLCFFISMLVTNDVALITFVPFTIGILGETNDDLIFILIMETIAANLGSMMTPIGNPQNLFLYSYYNLNIVDFVRIMLPVGALGLFMILVILLLRRKGSSKIEINQTADVIEKRQLIKYLLMLAVCIMTVLHIINYLVCLAIVVLALLVGDKKLFKKIDYMLLLTFVCFFIFVGNINSLQEIREVVGGVINNREILVSAIVSQGISNVPAAIMLAPFTDRAAELLVGTNIGGLGTIIASMASLITYKFYSTTKEARTKRYLVKFSAINFVLFTVFLIILV